MKYVIIKDINERTKFATFDNDIYVLKEIPISDTEMYKKLISLDCENVVKFYETINIDDKFYVVEEYITGMTLKNSIDNCGYFDENRTKEIALQICEGLKAIHKLGIVHRDINPNNILLTSDGKVKIIDFGISRVVKQKQSQDTEILGTQGFTAPEQFGFHQTNDKADIYSLGVLINYMLTGKLPSEKVVKGYMCEIILKCTQIDEVNRYDSINELIDALNQKSSIKNFFRTVPGFRKGIWWHYLIACIYYIFLAVLFIGLITSGKGLIYILTSSVEIMFMLLVPVPILTNYRNWTNKFDFIRSKQKSTKIAIQICLAILSVFISAVLILIEPNV